MASGTEHVTRQVFDYVVSHSSPPDPLLAELRAETARRFPADAGLQIRPEQGTFMTLLSRIFDVGPDPDARAVRAFNEQALADDRVELALLSIGDGVIFARKR